MNRRSRNLWATISLISSIAIVLLWIRTCSRDDEIMLFSKYGLGTRPHAIIIRWCTWPYFKKTPLYQSSPSHYWDIFDFFKFRVKHFNGGGLHAPSTDVWFMGFIYSSDRQLGFTEYGAWVPACHFVDITIPLYFLLALTLPGLINWALRLQKRQTGNFYALCGYDLRATPDRCPECGK